MAVIEASDVLKLVPTFLKSSSGLVWTRYDREADVLYVNFEKPAIADDSELTDDDVIIRRRGDEVIGLTVLHASQR
ncbi:MAG TPA: DUF2283 domain-containing protein [Tepidisphaeraceae bacterium]|jgi:uncharacterized protein YuzE